MNFCVHMLHFEFKENAVEGNYCKLRGQVEHCWLKQKSDGTKSEVWTKEGAGFGWAEREHRGGMAQERGRGGNV